MEPEVVLFVGPSVGEGGSFGLRRGWEVKLTGGGGGEGCFEVVVAALDVGTSTDNAFRKLLFSKNKKYTIVTTKDQLDFINKN